MKRIGRLGAAKQPPSTFDPSPAPVLPQAHQHAGMDTQPEITTRAPRNPEPRSCQRVLPGHGQGHVHGETHSTIRGKHHTPLLVLRRFSPGVEIVRQPVPMCAEETASPQLLGLVGEPRLPRACPPGRRASQSHDRRSSMTGLDSGSEGTLTTSTEKRRPALICSPNSSMVVLASLTSTTSQVRVSRWSRRVTTIR